MFGFQEEIRELKVQLNTLQHVEPQMMDTSILSAGSVAPSAGKLFRAGFRQDQLVAGAVSTYVYVCICPAMLVLVLFPSFFLLIPIFHTFS